MGQIYSSLNKYFFSKPEKIIVLYGLEAAGKTSVFNKMQLDEITYPMPMPDLCEGRVDLKKFRFYILDIARRLTARYEDTYFASRLDAIILVVDSTNSDGIDECNRILTDMLLSEQLKDVIILIFANKQDMPNALNPTKVAEKMKLSERKRICHIQGTSGSTGDGVLEGLEYLQTFFYKQKWFNIF